MKCVNCNDHDIKRKCCGSVSISETKKNYLIERGLATADDFYQTNDGWFIKNSEAGRYITEEGNEMIVSRCVFLNLDTGKCDIYADRPPVCETFPKLCQIQDCPNEFHPREDEQSCGEGGYEGSGYNE